MECVLRRLALASLLVCATATGAHAVITPLGLYPVGACYNGCAVGDTVYWGSGPVLRIADLSQPDQPRDIGRVTIGYAITNVFAVPGRAYVSAGNQWLIVVDTADPTAPRVVGSLWRYRRVWGMGTLGNYLLIGNANDGVEVLDVSDPAHILSVGHWYTSGSVHGLIVEGSLVYAECGGQGLVVLDFSDPLRPALVGQIKGFVPGYGLAKAGPFVYIPESPSGLTIIDVSDPHTPVARGFYPNLTNGTYVAAEGGLVYTSSLAEGIQAIDVSNPDQPVRVGQFADWQAQSVFLGRKWLYVPSRGLGLYVIDKSQPVAMPEVGLLDENGYSLGVAAQNGTVYLTSWWDGLRILDGRDPAAPRLLARVPIYASYTPVLRDGIAYVPAADAGALVIDVHDPANPVPLATMFGSWVRGLVIEGNYAYLADSGWGLLIYDISNPASPQQVSSVLIGGEINDVAVSGGWAYIANGLQGLRRVDVRNPSAPVLGTAFATADYCIRTVIDGQTAIIFEGTAGLEICHLSDDGLPVRQGSIGGWHMLDGAVQSGRLYVADDQFGVWVYDITDPSLPVLRGTIDDVRGAQRVAVDGNTIWVSIMEEGVRSYRDDALTPVTLAGFRAARTGGAVRLDWRLGALEGILGLDVYRQTAGTDRERLTASPLAPVATGSYVDASPPTGPASYWLQASSAGGGAIWLGETAVAGAAPERFAFWSAGPNPFNPRASLRLALPRPGRVALVVYDQRGRRVRDLLDAELPAGERAVTWDGTTDAGGPAPSGVYVARLVTDLGTRAVKLTLAR